MKFKALSNEKRRLELDMEKINLYVSRYKKFTPFDIEIVRRQKKRSDPLRKYYFGKVLKDLMAFSGYERDEELEVHKYLKGRYFNVERDERGIYKKRDMPSVFSNKSDLDVSVKKEFVDWVIRLAAKSGCIIEDPS